MLFMDHFSCSFLFNHFLRKRRAILRQKLIHLYIDFETDQRLMKHNQQGGQSIYVSR